MVTPGHGVLLLVAGGGPDLLVIPFRLGVPHQARMQTPLPEVHALHNLCPADAQRLRENGVGEDEGSLGVPTPTEIPAPFRSQYCR